MKKLDYLVILVVLIILLPFFIFSPVYEGYMAFNISHAYIASYIKFAILATFGESIGLRIREGVYWKPGFGLLPRAFVWGILGISIKAAFVIFSGSASMLLGSLGILPPSDPGIYILAQTDFSWLKLLTAFTAAAMMNLYFAPVFMTAHKITDLHIMSTAGNLKRFFSPINIGEKFRQIDWMTMWNFIFKKTLILFWIPAQTINFMLPEEFRVLVAAFLSIILGIFLSVASIKKQKHDQTHSNVPAEGISVS